MSSARMNTILGTLRFSSHRPIFAEAIDKPTVAVASISVVILCSKWPSIFVPFEYPTDDERRIITAPALEMETIAIYMPELPGCD